MLTKANICIILIVLISRGRAARKLVGLITRRSVVQIRSPQPLKKAHQTVCFFLVFSFILKGLKHITFCNYPYLHLAYILANFTSKLPTATNFATNSLKKNAKCRLISSNIARCFFVLFYNFLINNFQIINFYRNTITIKISIFINSREVHFNIILNCIILHYTTTHPLVYSML